MIIMYEQFVDRKKEIEFLRSAYNSNRAEFIVIYGRRRIGKTRLVKESIKGCNALYFLADESTDNENRNRFKKQLAKMLNDPLIERADLDWYELFSYIKDGWIIVIDEFPYLIGVNKAIPSIFQRIWDEILGNKNVKLIIMGSSIGMMETEVLGYKSPLYGRRTGQIYLKPLKFRDVCKFFPNKSVEDIVKIYGITDGIPAYIQEVKYRLENGEKLEEVFLPNKPLYDEVSFLLRSELREPARYYAILKAIAYSNTKFGEIVNFTGFSPSTVSQYLSNLKKLHIVIERHPYGEREAKRNVRYDLGDNYFKFYFRFIYENRTNLESIGKIPNFDVEYNKYLGEIYEKIAVEFIDSLILEGKVEGRGCGKWWKKDVEIDVVCEGAEKAYFFEVKWKDIGVRDAYRILANLKDKAEKYKFYGDRVYGIIAKSIENKDRLRDDGFLIYDIKDISGRD